MDKDSNKRTSIRDHLIQEYKQRLETLGEEEFFRQFEEIRIECHKIVGAFVEDSNNQLDYIDPIHLPSYAASTLGRLGGLAKSEVKAQSSKENGKKGGRPKKVREETIEESNLDLFK